MRQDSAVFVKRGGYRAGTRDVETVETSSLTFRTGMANHFGAIFIVDGQNNEIAGWGLIQPPVMVNIVGDRCLPSSDNDEPLTLTGTYCVKVSVTDAPVPAGLQRWCRG